MNHDRTPPADVDLLIDFFAEQSGAFLPASRRAFLRQAAARFMRRVGIDDPRECLARLADDGDLYDALMVELTVRETYFFRIAHHFEMLGATILPELCARRGLEQPVRIWSAGCSTGEELYSVAVVADEAGLLRRCRLVGTDICRQALDQAREGVYGEWSMRDGAARRLERYLKPHRDGHQVDVRLRQAVEFAYLNLMDERYGLPTGELRELDVIFCRNVLLYFHNEAIAAVAGRLFDALSPGGWLLTAAADPRLDLHAPFETILTPVGLCYRRPPGLQPGMGPRPSLEARLEAPPARRPVRTPLRQPVRTPLATELERLEALACDDPAAALEACLAALRQASDSPELHYLHALILVSLDREEEALQAARRVLYLAPGRVMGHRLQGWLYGRLGDEAGRRRALLNAYEACMKLAEDAVVAGSGGLRAADLAAILLDELAGADEGGGSATFRLRPGVTTEG